MMMMMMIVVVLVVLLEAQRRSWRGDTASVMANLSSGTPVNY